MNRLDYLEQPFEVSIETFALCNARCTFCPYPTLDRKGERMPIQVIHSLIDEMATFKAPFFFSPFKVNEPLLDSRLLDICRYFEAQCPRGRLRLFTNGSPLTIEKIIEINSLRRVEHLWISLNSTRPEDYEKIMGLRYELTANRLDTLHSMVSEDFFEHPVVISRVVSDSNTENLQFVMDVKDRWPKFRSVLIKRDGWIDYVTASSTIIPRTPCVRWFELSIIATGKVSLCCMDGTGEYAIGDVMTQSLLDIYNAPAYRERRETSARRQHYSPCNRCTY